METQDGSERVQFLTFRVAGRSHALPVLSVREILPFRGATPIPLSPRAIRGLINLRGSAVPVLDLAVRLGHPATAESRRNCVVILDSNEAGSERLGLLTEEVEVVLALDPRELAPPPKFGDGVGHGLVESVAHIGEHFVPILAASKLFEWSAEAAAPVASDAAALAVQPAGAPETEGAATA